MTAAAILTADWHLSERPPVFRAREDDWYDAMARSISQVVELSQKCFCPIIIAGDVFDHWRAPPSLINFALGAIKDSKVYVVRGQHDLPNHSHSLIKRSAYWTLIKAKAVEELAYGKPCGGGPFQLWGFSWQKKLRPPTSHHSLCKNIAVVHKYVWEKGSGYPGAPKEALLSRGGESTGYDVIVYGDNHTPFEMTDDHGCLHFNCGSLMRRTSDQINYKPSVGILHDDGGVERHYLDCSKDVVDERERPKASFSFGVKQQTRTLDFVAELFREAENKKVSKGVISLLSQAVDNARSNHGPE